MYGKQTETAIAAVSYLAALWEGPATRRVSAADIADGRGLQRPFVAKLLSSLSQAGIVNGSPGPGGGYALAKNPNQISLRDVWLLFERPESSRVAFVGSKICGVSVPNDLSDRIGRVEQAMDSLLDDTTFDLFCGEPMLLVSRLPAEHSEDRQAG
jgi:Rrf2 family iron-sulfur cluster assembly transcriptional regulator